MKRLLALAFVLTAVPAFAQTSGVVPKSDVPRYVTLPATCVLGQEAIQTGGTAGRYLCTAANTWTLLGSGGSGDAFTSIPVSGQTTLTASGSTPLEVVAGSGVTLTTNNASSPKTLTIAASGGGGTPAGWTWDATALLAPDGTLASPFLGVVSTPNLGFYRDAPVLQASAWNPPTLIMSTPVPAPPAPTVTLGDPNSTTNGVHEVYLTWIDGSNPNKESGPSPAAEITVTDNKDVVISIPELLNSALLPYGVQGVVIYMTTAGMTGFENAHYVTNVTGPEDWAIFSRSYGSSDAALGLRGLYPHFAGGVLAAVPGPWIQDGALVSVDSDGDYGSPVQIIRAVLPPLANSAYVGVQIGDLYLGALYWDNYAGALYPSQDDTFSLGVSVAAGDDADFRFKDGTFTGTLTASLFSAIPAITTGGAGQDFVLRATDAASDGMSTPFDGGNILLTTGVSADGGTDGVLKINGSTGVTANGGSCVITDITHGIITGATCS